MAGGGAMRRPATATIIAPIVHIPARTTKGGDVSNTPIADYRVLLLCAPCQFPLGVLDGLPQELGPPLAVRPLGGLLLGRVLHAVFGHGRLDLRRRFDLRHCLRHRPLAPVDELPLRCWCPHATVGVEP
eukprot:581849-Prorocentrum_minimum.AAC.1